MVRRMVGSFEHWAGGSEENNQMSEILIPELRVLSMIANHSQPFKDAPAFAVTIGFNLMVTSFLLETNFR
jgi:hypothetical protein